MDSIDRVRLFKLAWDAVGSEFGSRHTQYEMFYSGASFVTRGHAFRSYPWEQATGLVDDAMLRLQPRPGSQAAPALLPSVPVATPMERADEQADGQRSGA